MNHAADQKTPATPQPKSDRFRLWIGLALAAFANLQLVFALFPLRWTVATQGEPHALVLSVAMALGFLWIASVPLAGYFLITWARWRTKPLAWIAALALASAAAFITLGLHNGHGVRAVVNTASASWLVIGAICLIHRTISPARPRKHPANTAGHNDCAGS
ncbi:MAG: hypothetical protein GXY33_07190 [Phycisphaerae bacterium]|nr:hypothetical protein [Phycisphaerae bacterium]